MIVPHDNSSIFDSVMQTLVNPVNCVGISGKGLALHFKDRYPEMFKRYQRDCTKGLYFPGACLLYRDDTHNILNFATKRHWRDDSQVEWIETGLQALSHKYRLWGINSLAVPALGCGNGNLHYYEDGIYDLLVQYLDPIDIPVELYEG